MLRFLRFILSLWRPILSLERQPRQLLLRQQQNWNARERKRRLVIGELRQTESAESAASETKRTNVVDAVTLRAALVALAMTAEVPVQAGTAAEVVVTLVVAILVVEALPATGKCIPVKFALLWGLIL